MHVHKVKILDEFIHDLSDLDMYISSARSSDYFHIATCSVGHNL